MDNGSSAAGSGANFLYGAVNIPGLSVTFPGWCMVRKHREVQASRDERNGNSLL